VREQEFEDSGIHIRAHGLHEIAGERVAVTLIGMQHANARIEPQQSVRAAIAVSASRMAQR
jgi:hypothetical protein